MAEQEKEIILDPVDRELVDALENLTAEDFDAFRKELSEKTCEALKNKYHRDFTVFLMGDMFPGRIARMYIHPVNEPEKVFSALVSMNGEIRDDYPVSGLLHGVEQEIRESFTGAGITCCANVVLPTGEILEGEALSLETFLKKNGMDRVLCRLIFPEGTDIAGIIPTLEKTCGKIPADVAVNGFVLPADGYGKCAENFRRYPSSTEALISRFSPIISFFTFVKDGHSSTTTEELLLRSEG